MKIYSPSQTKSYLESPIGWYLHYVDGWSPKVLGRKELSGFLGSAFAHGMDSLTKAGHLDQVVLIKESKERLHQDIGRALDLGHTIAGKEIAFFDNLPDHLEKALLKVINNSPIPLDWRILESEVRIPEAGNCRLDLLIDTPQGISFVDYKTKVTLEGYAKDRAITDWSQDWQFYHYTWALDTFRQMSVNSFSVALVIISGSVKPSLHTFPLDQELFKIWEVSAREIWRQMEACELGERVAIWDFQMSNKYGADPWVEAIVHSKLDEALMSRNYVRRAR